MTPFSNYFWSQMQTIFIATTWQRSLLYLKHPIEQGLYGLNMPDIFVFNW